MDNGTQKLEPTLRSSIINKAQIREDVEFFLTLEIDKNVGKYKFYDQQVLDILWNAQIEINTLVESGKLKDTSHDRQ